MHFQENVVEVAGLCKSYRAGTIDVPVLADVNLTVRRGECLFLAGPSGSGKTTLLSILGCVLSADAGHVRILGADVTGLTRPQQARFRREAIGFVFQRFHLFDALTAMENVRVPFELLQQPRTESNNKVRELLSLVGLSDLASRTVTQLSMGQRQRVAIARALAGDPQLVLADEPTASLDGDSGMQSMVVLKDLCQRLGKTVIVVTHDARIFPLADRILHLAGGTLDDGCARNNSKTTQSL